jgi:hypothetical protein
MAEAALNCTEALLGRLLCSDGLEYVEYEPPLSPASGTLLLCLGVSVLPVVVLGGGADHWPGGDGHDDAASAGIERY